MAAKVYVTENNERIYGIMAEFASPGDLYHAAEKVRDAGYSKWDTFSPFPVHGMEEAMGIKRTILPVLVAIGGFSGVGFAYWLQWWVSNHGYKFVVQGKPFGSLLSGGWQVFVPITFELGVLFAAFTALLSMFALNGLPRHHHPLMKKERFLASSDDKFFIAIEAKDGKFDPEGTKSLLKNAGATSIELVEE